MNTRIKMYVLLDHQEYYGFDREISDLVKLIGEIPTETVINLVSWMNVNQYLNETDERPGFQAQLVGAIQRHLNTVDQARWIEVLQEQKRKGHNPMLVWNYSNLLLLDFVFQNVNKKMKTQLTSDEAKGILDAFLIVNSSINKKISKNLSELQDAIDNRDSLDDFVIANFSYQKDYESSTDFNNQVLRGKMFFEFLEGHSKYGEYLKEFYSERHVQNYKQMFKALMAIFAQIEIETNQRNHFISLQAAAEENLINLEYVDTLSINMLNGHYMSDESFGLLRTRFLYKVDQYRFLLLDVNFLLDQFYKAQVFSFNSFLKRKNSNADFLSVKAKEFLEDIYFKRVIKACFPFYIKVFGKECLNSKGEELCDGYLRDRNKICLIELKDILLSASVKNSGDSVKLVAELSKKFVANQDNKRKGISQLLDAIDDIENDAISFDPIETDEKIQVFPVIVYTDNTFGAPGLNRLLGKRFMEGLSSISLTSLHVHPLTFINLSFFELREEYLSNKHLDIFEMLEAYHIHVRNLDYQLTTFEVFGKFYMEGKQIPDLGTNSTFSQLVKEIIES